MQARRSPGNRTSVGNQAENTKSSALKVAGAGHCHGPQVGPKRLALVSHGGFDACRADTVFAEYAQAL
ncbi:MAG: hypothetical protein ACJA07_001870 [Rhodococcus sp. (in: high G+C Gram-positive bacteria)]